MGAGKDAPRGVGVGHPFAGMPRQGGQYRAKRDHGTPPEEAGLGVEPSRSARGRGSRESPMRPWTGGGELLQAGGVDCSMGVDAQVRQPQCSDDGRRGAGN